MLSHHCSTVSGHCHNRPTYESRLPFHPRPLRVPKSTHKLVHRHCPLHNYFFSGPLLLMLSQGSILAALGKAPPSKTFQGSAVLRPCECCHTNFLFEKSGGQLLSFISLWLFSVSDRGWWIICLLTILCIFSAGRSSSTTYQWCRRHSTLAILLVCLFGCASDFLITSLLQVLCCRYRHLTSRSCVLGRVAHHPTTDIWLRASTDQGETQRWYGSHCGKLFRSTYWSHSLKVATVFEEVVRFKHQLSQATIFTNLPGGSLDGNIRTVSIPSQIKGDLPLLLTTRTSV